MTTLTVSLNPAPWARDRVDLGIQGVLVLSGTIRVEPDGARRDVSAGTW